MKVTERTYIKSEVITFSSTKGEFGGLSNMAPGFSLFVNEINIQNSEALYQSCRFPLFPDIQEEILKQKSPIDAKNISRKYVSYTRQDWELVKFDIMRWCLMVKLIQNWDSFSQILISTGDKQIVEYSTKDKVWAASPSDNNTLTGKNALGRLLMQIREDYVKPNLKPNCVNPLGISAFLLFDTPISKVFVPEYNFLDFSNEYFVQLA